jgi:magnesium-transporting ATPase (P-type)
MEQMNPHQDHHGHHDHHDQHEMQRHGAGRVIVYFIVLIILNIMLAVYMLYILGFALSFDWTSLASGTLQVILESAWYILLYISPVILTIILNRLLYRSFRGRGRFPHGIWFFAMLAIIAVQVATIALIFNYGFVDGVDGLNIEQIATTPLD